MHERIGWTRRSTAAVPRARATAVAALVALTLLQGACSGGTPGTAATVGPAGTADAVRVTVAPSAAAANTVAPAATLAAAVSGPLAPGGGAAPSGDAAVQGLGVEIVASYPHDPEAFTQGLVLLDDRTLLESTGLYGRSSLREVDLETGAIRRSRDLPPDLFAEGLALVGDELLQLTWREQVAVRSALDSFEMVDSHRYVGEGWGLCFDGSRLVMSDGSSRLTFRRPEDLSVVGEVTVTVGSVPIAMINELECVGDRVVANVWQTDYILAIDPADGSVESIVDASDLLAPEERSRADVLNGIAWRASSETFLITGKLWPKLFEVRFVPAPGPATAAAPAP